VPGVARAVAINGTCVLVKVLASQPAWRSEQLVVKLITGRNTQETESKVGWRCSLINPKARSAPVRCQLQFHVLWQVRHCFIAEPSSFGAP